jgi:single-stranded DNA-specific DHH superfamily exonuclease
MDEAIAFLKKITEKDNIIVVFHNDADGCCSCVLLDKFLKSHIGKKSDYIISQPMPPAKNLISKIKLSMPTKIIFLDLGVDQTPPLIKKLENECDVLIIDHHQIMNSLNSKKTVHYNPMFKSKVYQSASYLTYKICSKIIDMREHLWISMVGIIGDYNVADSMDVVEEAKKAYPDFIHSTDQDDLHRSIFGQMADMISAAKASKITCEEIVRNIETMESIRDIDKNESMTNAYKNVQSEIERILIDAKSGMDSSRTVIFYEIKSHYNVHSPISTLLSKEFPKKLIIVWESIGNKIKVSARNQNKKINVGKVLREATHDIRHASAGGHEAAGGVSLKSEDWDEFKDRLVALAEK